jgi:hypothetical protein
MEAGSGFHRWLKSLRPADVRISQLRRRAEPTRFLYGIECEHPERWHRRNPDRDPHAVHRIDGNGGSRSGLVA